jgi:hypothetical protein
MSWFPYFAVAYNKETAGMFWLDRLYFFLFRLDGLEADLSSAALA